MAFNQRGRKILLVFIFSLSDISVLLWPVHFRLLAEKHILTCCKLQINSFHAQGGQRRGSKDVDYSFDCILTWKAAGISELLIA